MANRPFRLEARPPSARRRTRYAAICVLAVLGVAAVSAQTVPTGVQEYYVLGWEQHIWDMMDRVQNGQGGAQFADGMNSVVTATASADNQVVYYDHWEDGPDAELANFPTVNPALLQGSTVVIGDGIAGNGDACDFNANLACGTDLLSAGDYVNFNSDRGLGGGCSTPLTPQRCSVPLNPRDSNDIHFDGGDLIKTSGGPLTVIHSQYPLTNYIGGSTEILSRQAVEAARSYSVPIGEDLYVANTVTEPFHYVELELVAFADTSITVDSPGAGSVSFTLARGEHWSSMGYIDDTSSPALGLTINAGSKVATTAPISGMIFTGGDGTWATRHYALLPDILHSTDYVTTAPGDNPTGGPTTNGTPQNRPANVYILNPDTLTALDVTITDTSGSYVVTIPANSMRSMDDIGAGRDIAANSTVRMTSDRSFWGVTAYDYNTNISDWGHSWLAKKFLTNTYTVSFGPGNQNQPPNASQYGNPVFVAATADRTRVQFDLDNDGSFDQVDLDGNGTADAAPYADNTYEVNMLAALKVIDPTDNDMTGARIVANKEVAVSWGQDPDRSYYNDQALDTGFTIYPVNQIFLDPALTIDKEVDTTVVPTASVDPAERTVTYTLTVKSYEFGPLSNVEVWDLLPNGVFGDTDYKSGTTLITCPNLVQGTTDPAFDDCTGGVQCRRLTWDIEGACGAGFTLGTNSTLTVTYQVVIPPAPSGPRLLNNEGHAQATLGGSVFSPSDTAQVVQTDVTLTKAVDVTTPAAGDEITFTLQVANTGSTNETQVYVSDPVPDDTTFVPGSITGTGVFAGSGVYDVAQNAVEWNAANFPPGATATLTFKVRVNPTVPAGTEIPNRGGYESFETPYFLSNEVDPVVLGPALETLKSIVDDPSVVHPDEDVIFDIMIANSGAAAAANVVLVDPFPANAGYVVESMQWSLNEGPFTSLTDANDGDEGGGADGRAFPDRVEFRLASLGPSQNVSLRFTVQVDPGTAGQFLINQGTFASDETPSTDTNLVQVPIRGNSVLTGHVFSDTDGDGTQDPGEPDLPDLTVVVVDSMGSTLTVTTDANGDWSVTVEAGAATADVDENDPDFPEGAVLSTANDPQPATAVDGATVATADVGYTPLPLSFFKTSDAGGEVFPGDPITYTIRATNYTAVDQTNVVISDPLPPGTLAVPGSTSVTVSGGPIFRVREYYIAPGTFGDTSYDLTLGDNLSQDYFVVVQGAAGGGGDKDPEADYARLTADPSGTGDLAASGSADVIRIERNDGNDSWSGVVTVVECLSECDTAGFRLRSVESVLYNGAAESGTDTAGTGWGLNINRVLLMGGFNGAGCSTDENTDRDHPVCHARLYPSGTDTINWTRDGSNGSVDLTDATSTVMVVEWGSEWTVQRARVSGTNGGDGLDATGEFNTAGLTTPVARANTWVWGTGHADGAGIGDQAEGALIALGNGVDQNATESLVAVGTEISGTAVDFEVWALTHPSLSVEHLFKADGDSGETTADLAATAAGSQRMALATNGQDGASDNYARPILSARYFNPSLIRLERRRSGSPFPALAQGIDFSDIVSGTTFTGGDPAALVTAVHAVTLGPLATIVVTFDVTVDPDIAPATTEITNTAELTTDQEGPLYQSVTDDVIRVAVVVEYDNAGYGLVGQKITYFHEVVNTGLANDSYGITLDSELDWLVELIDPATGAVIATDASGDGDSLWDGGTTINTGTLAPGETAQYEIRVTIPSGGPVGVEESTSLIATSDRRPSTWAIATDETVAVGALDPIIFLPDNSGVAPAGGTAAYGHRIINNTGATDTFDLKGWSENGWDFAFHWDANADGVFTPGVDVEITNTLQLADGASQLIFAVVDVPGATADGTVDVVHLGAESRNNVCDPVSGLCDPYLFASATDTTTVAPPTELDLSGGGTRSVSPGGTAVFPGTIRNLTAEDDVYDFTISRAWFWNVDGLNHPTELWIDANGDGLIQPLVDTLLAVDADGDGTWNTVNADADGNGLPDAGVAAGSVLAYVLQRAVDPNQNSMRDPVTLTALPQVASDEDSITATVLVAAATAAVLADFDAYAFNGRVVVEWRTSAEVGTIGFDLWRWIEGQSAYERVNNALVPGLRYVQGGTYRLVDGGVTVGDSVVYYVYERDVWGSGSTFGPFETTIDERGSGSAAKAAHALAAGLHRVVNRSSVRTADVKSQEPDGTPSGMVKIIIRDDGLVRVSADELAAALVTEPAIVTGWIGNGNLWISTGVDAGPPSTLIFADGFEGGDDSRWGMVDEVPDEPDGVAWRAVEDNNALVFWGEAIDSIYTADNVYWLGVGPGLRMKTRPAAAVETKSLGSFPENLHFEEDQWPLTAVMTDPEADFWMWDYFFPYEDEPTVTKSFTLTTPGVAPTGGSVHLTVRLQGSFETAVPDNHLVRLSLNGTDLGGSWKWSDHDPFTLELDVPQAVLNDGDNSLEITASLAEGLDFDEFYIDSIDLAYRRLHLADDDQLSATSGGSATVTVDGFSSDQILVFDIADPRKPVVVTGVPIVPGSGGYSASFSVSGSDLPFVATTADAVGGPASLEVDIGSSLKDAANQGRYVVVAGAGLEGEAAVLAAYREQQGMPAVVAPVADIYDEFNGGVVSPWAIRQFLRHASEHWAVPPQYVFLAGDGTLDYENVWGANESLVPAPMTVAQGGLAPSDNSLADWIGDDGVPEIAIGRLPAQSSAELAAYREKLVAFESSADDWKRQTLWLADAADEGGEFAVDLLALADNLPPGFTSERIVVDWLGAEAARERALSSWDKGALLVEFLGHGALDFISNSGLVTTEDVPAMANNQRTPVLAALTCMVGRFDIPDYDILSEALLLEPDGGSIGVWSPSAFSMNEDAALLGGHHIDAIASGEHETVGGSIRAALAAYAAAGVGDPVLPRIFIFLGDPATRVDW